MPYVDYWDAFSPTQNYPINCVNWYEAYAFCIWDGGFLPTVAEWNYAAVGGSEYRFFPWSVPPEAIAIDCTYASYTQLDRVNGFAVVNFCGPSSSARTPPRATESGVSPILEATSQNGCSTGARTPTGFPVTTARTWT